MAFAVKYRMEFTERKSQNGYTPIDWKIELSKDGYVGSVTDLDGYGTSPFKIEWKGETADKYGWKKSEGMIKPSFVKLLIRSTSLQFVEFITDTDEYTTKAEVYKNGSLYWSGYVKGDKYTERWEVAHDVPVLIVATDGLEKLAQMDYKDTSGNYYSGQKSELTILLDILNQLNLDLDLAEAVNMYEYSMNKTSSDSPLDQLDLNSEYFREGQGQRVNLQFMKCDQVVKAILAKYGARLMQNNGRWEVHRINEQDGTSYNRRLYNSSGTYQSVATLSGVSQLAGYSEGDTIAFKGSMQIEKALKKAIVNYEGGRANNLIIDGGFEEVNWETSSELLRWTKSDASVVLSKTASPLDSHNGFTNYACQITSVAATTGAAEHIESEGQAVKKDSTLFFSLAYKVVTSAGSGTLPQIGYRIQLETVNEFGAPVSYGYNGSGSFTVGTNIQWVSVPDASALGQWLDIELSNINIPEDGILSLHLYECVNNGYTVTGVHYDRCIGEIESGDVLAEAFEMIAESADGYSKEINIDLILGDKGTYSEHIYKNSIRSFLEARIQESILIPTTDYITLDIAGTTRTYTVAASYGGLGSRTWTTVAELIAEIDNDDGSNYYSVWEVSAGGGNKDLFILAENWEADTGGTHDFGTVSVGSGRISVTTQNDNTDPASLTAQYDNARMEVGGEHTGKWTTDGGTTYDNIIDILLQTVMNDHKRNTYRMRGKIYDFMDEINMASVVEDQNHNSGKYLLMMGGTYDLLRGVWDVELAEITSATNSITESKEPIAT